jgi:hypothetical protein
VHVSFLNSRLDGAKFAPLGIFGSCAFAPTQRSGDRARVVQRMLDLMRQARQRVILRD